MDKELILANAEELYKKNQALAENNHTLMLLRQIDTIVLGAVDTTETVLQQVAGAVAADSDFSFVVIYLRNHQRRALVPAAFVGSAPGPAAVAAAKAELMATPVTLRHKINPMARCTDQRLIVSSQRLYEIVQPNLPIPEAEELQQQLGLKLFYVCPLVARGEVLGTMVLGSRLTPEALSFYQKSLLERLTIAVGLALDNTLLYAETQAAAKRLRTANRHLRELDVAKDEFISMASHQLRTPLTSIKGYISMVLEGEAGSLTKDQREFLEYAYNGSQRMVNLISDLLNVSRLSAGKFRIEKAPADLGAIVAQEVHQLNEHAKAKGLKLTYDPPAKALGLVNVDATKTREVTMNFIDNAVHYTRQGSVNVSLQLKGKRIELRVKDTGIGVPEKAKAKLFTKFFRAGNAQTMRPDGTGLGLFLAKRVIEDQGGALLFESTEGQGSLFGFSLPYKPEESR